MEPKGARAYVAELVGTFVLVLFIAGFFQYAALKFEQTQLTVNIKSGRSKVNGNDFRWIIFLLSHKFFFLSDQRPDRFHCVEIA